MSRACWDVVEIFVTGRHTAFEVTFPDSLVIYFDEGGP
ncbi:hypothetical protein Sinac_0710 [Singulisphaera acidiphila DSM 18658]|uniref:Uncharacterized protein n=1 Tax=Singulisphaera acidiphila (strain ATCC BAA-1392 / DSM 18658 / VKM B-2454 / MOB10) TaxID=886293 RepID=L0D8Z9_SINAD|nr:hypothetical protein Sinac_0710 [Singulisphaera acidiphila DSM 18658]